VGHNIHPSHPTLSVSCILVASGFGRAHESAQIISFTFLSSIWIHHRITASPQRRDHLGRHGHLSPRAGIPTVTLPHFLDLGALHDSHLAAFRPTCPARRAPLLLFLFPPRLASSLDDPRLPRSGWLFRDPHARIVHPTPAAAESSSTPPFAGLYILPAPQGLGTCGSRAVVGDLQMRAPRSAFPAERH
jgi:hypothetical protein